MTTLDPPTPEPILVGPEEAAKMIRLGRSTVYQLLADGKLPSIKIGRAVRVPVAALHRWAEEELQKAKEVRQAS